MFSSSTSSTGNPGSPVMDDPMSPAPIASTLLIFTAAVLASTALEATAFARRSPNLCLAFVASQIPTTGGLGLMEQLHQVDPRLTVIVMSTSGTVAAAVEATKRGAEDY